MQTLLIYFSKTILVSGLMLLYYSIALRNKSFHYYNRFYLLFTVVTSICLPLLHIEWFSLKNNSSSAIHMYKLISSGGNEDVVVTSHTGLDWQMVLLTLLSAISIIMILQLLFQVYKILRLKRTYPVEKFAEFDFVNTDLQSAPFSFLKNIFWRNDIQPDDASGQRMLQHELTHIKQKHSIDAIFIQLVLCVYWMNPFFWLLKKELYLIHEFIADEKAVANKDAAAFAEMLLIAHYSKFEFFPAQSFFYSPIKRRLIMLTTSKKPQFSYLRRIMVLPLIASVVCLFAFTVKNQHTTLSTQKITAGKPFVLVVDAGHGGKDLGAFGNGLYEKNMNLKIAEEIKKLSPEYGIDVILTRDNDVFMSPPQKADFANAQNADAFISIHINSQPKQFAPDSGMEVYVAKHNETVLNNSKVLGSAIIQNLETNFSVQPELMQRQIGIYVMDQSKVPCALIECGYITNANDAKLLKDDAKVELMARNILQGVAMYANNSFDKDKLLQIKSSDTSVPAQSSSMQSEHTPLYVYNGMFLSKSTMDQMNVNDIETINVLKDQKAMDKYGEKGKYGVVEILLKADNVPTSFTSPMITKDSNFIEPQFPGGKDGWVSYLEKNLHADVPAKRNAPKGKYTALVSFDVSENGKVSNVKALKDPGYGCAEEAVRVIADGPNWLPGKINNKPISTMEKKTITFQVTK